MTVGFDGRDPLSQTDRRVNFTRGRHYWPNDVVACPRVSPERLLRVLYQRGNLLTCALGDRCLVLPVSSVRFVTWQDHQDIGHQDIGKLS